ncbi:MAG: hypothetical protein IPP33_01855 [Flavobacteriales bacterium]|nr:hypothetical protein [Flavobacteriales bacterium]
MRVSYKLFALLSLAAAAYHLVDLFHVVNDSPLWHSALFVAIDVFCAYGLLCRPRCGLVRDHRIDMVGHRGSAFRQANDALRRQSGSFFRLI